MLTLILIITMLAVAHLAPTASAHTYPSWPMPRTWRPPAAWLPGAMCVHRHESVDWHRAGIDWRGNRSPYYGGMQFLVSTWRRAGASGLPSDATPREQLYRAWVIWRSHGGSWSEWGTRGACGLR